MLWSAYNSGLSVVYTTECVQLGALSDILTPFPVSVCRDFKTNQGATYACKWYAPLDSVEIVEPDYHSDIWDHILCGGIY